MFGAVNVDKACFVIDGWIHAPLIMDDDACLPVLHLLTKPRIIYMLVVYFKQIIIHQGCTNTGPNVAVGTKFLHAGA
jgi:hypothetical protein